MSAREWLPPRESFITATAAVLFALLAVPLLAGHPSPGRYIAFGALGMLAVLYALVSVFEWFEHWRCRGVPWLSMTVVDDGREGSN